MQPGPAVLIGGDNPHPHHFVGALDGYMNGVGGHLVGLTRAGHHLTVSCSSYQDNLTAPDVVSGGEILKAAGQDIAVLQTHHEHPSCLSFACFHGAGLPLPLMT